MHHIADALSAVMAKIVGTVVMGIAEVNIGGYTKPVAYRMWILRPVYTMLAKGRVRGIVFVCH